MRDNYSDLDDLSGSNADIDLGGLDLGKEGLDDNDLTAGGKTPDDDSDDDEEDDDDEDY